jgi:hypothetical protein
MDAYSAAKAELEDCLTLACRRVMPAELRDLATAVPNETIKSTEGPVKNMGIYGEDKHCIRYTNTDNLGKFEEQT